MTKSTHPLPEDGLTYVGHSLLPALATFFAMLVVHVSSSIAATTDYVADAASLRCGSDEIAVQAVISASELELRFRKFPDSGHLPQHTKLHALHLGAQDAASLAWLDSQGQVLALRPYEAISNQPFLLFVSQCRAQCETFTARLDNDAWPDLIIHQLLTGELEIWHSKAGTYSSAQGVITDKIIGSARVSNEFQDDLIVLKGNRLYAYPLEQLGRPQLVLDKVDLETSLVHLGNFNRGTGGALLQGSRLPQASGWLRISPLAQPKAMSLFFHAQFYPLQYNWVTNSLVADVNADGLDDLIVSAVESRNLWAALSTELGAIEVPAKGELPVHNSLQAMTSGDFTGDGAADLLYLDRATKDWWIAESQAVVPARDLSFSFTSVTVTSNREGRFCLTKKEHFDTVHMPIVSDSRLQPRAVVRLGEDRARLILEVRRGGKTGARFLQSAQEHGPFVCAGYQPEVAVDLRQARNGKWRPVHAEGTCPKGYGLYFTRDSKNSIPLSELSPDSLCCPLPALQIVAETVKMAAERCPENMFVSGVSSARTAGAIELRCQQLDSTRYRLGPETPGVYWGHGFSARGEKDAIRYDQIPLAIRPAAGRIDYDAWENDGCIGSPPGSLLTGRSSIANGCARWIFRELQYAGVPGDPPAGTPVEMFPACEAIEDIYLPTSYCRGAPSSNTSPYPRK